MIKVFILAMLCVALAGGIELENICSEDCFVYKSVQVNAFHRFRWNVTFQPISHYLIGDDVNCDPAEFKVKVNFWEALKIKHE